MHLPIQRLETLDKLSHSAINPDKPSQGAIQNTLDKKGLQSPEQTHRMTDTDENLGTS